MTGKRAIAARGRYEGMIRQLEDELREYDELKSGDLPLPNVERLDRSPPLSRRCVFSGECLNLNLRAGLGFSKQVISPPKTTTAVRAGATRKRISPFRGYWRPPSRSLSISDCSGF